MAKSDIKKLSRIKLIRNILTRKNVIKSASNKPVEKVSSYKPNILARELHPSKQFLKVSKIEVENPYVKTYTLIPNILKGTRSLAYFSAGQYISVSVEINGRIFTRPYSLSSSPREALNGRYKITIKRNKLNLVANYILDNWDIGSEIEVSAPLGNFTYERLRDGKTVIGIAGGSGITPFHSLAKSIADGDEDARLVLLYGSRCKEDILFKNEFDYIQAQTDKVKVVYVLEQGDDDCEKGYITAELIKKYAPENEEYSVFLCGPQGLYSFEERELEKLQIRKKFLRYEVFGAYNLTAEKDGEYFESTKDHEVNVTVIIHGEQNGYKVKSEYNLLSSLEQLGVNPPSRCKSGICGWCRSKLIEGEVYIPSTVDGRRLADKENSFIHPCVCFPLTDIVIEIPSVESL